MFVLSIAIWGVLVYSLRVAVFGNPLANLLLEQDVETLRNAERAAKSGPAGTNTRDIHILRRFSRLTLLEMIMFLLEAGILVYLMLSTELRWLAAALFAKDVAAMILSVICTRRVTREGGMLTAFRDLPGWLHVADRLSAGISAAGFLYLFLALNHIFGLGGAG